VHCQCSDNLHQVISASQTESNRLLPLALCTVLQIHRNWTTAQCWKPTSHPHCGTVLKLGVMGAACDWRTRKLTSTDLRCVMRCTSSLQLAALWAVTVHDRSCTKAAQCMRQRRGPGSRRWSDTGAGAASRASTRATRPSTGTATVTATGTDTVTATVPAL
jgi:hypothetical protein